MTCGIYKLTFPSGNFYIGKSTDIAKRWKQHWDNFSKGKHTKNMQAEFNIYGDYTQEIIFECHEDHIDIAEETFIARLCPPLNGTKGRDRLNCDGNEDIFLSYFNMSTLEHITELHNGKNTISTLRSEIEERENTEKELDEFIEELQVKRRAEEIEADSGLRLTGMEDALKRSLITSSNLSLECEKLSSENHELWKYKQLPWYKKIFA